jgi:hypothetical protein
LWNSLDEKPFCIDTDMTTANTITVRTNTTNPELLREGRPLASACVKAAKREALRHADASGRLGKQFWLENLT